MIADSGIYAYMLIYLMVVYYIGNIVGLIEIKVKGYRCNRCGHEWIPKGKDEPMVCPNCKSPYWNKPRKKKVSK